MTEASHRGAELPSLLRCLTGILCAPEALSPQDSAQLDQKAACGDFTADDGWTYSDCSTLCHERAAENKTSNLHVKSITYWWLSANLCDQGSIAFCAGS